MKMMVISEGLDGFPFFVVLCSNIRRIHFSWQGGHVASSSARASNYSSCSLEFIKVIDHSWRGDCQQELI